MKNNVWMLCITLLLTVLLVGCTRAADPETTADTQKQSAAADSKPDPAAGTTVPTEPTTAPTEPTTAPTEPTTAPTEPTTAPTEPTTAPAEPTQDPADTGGMYLLVNGARIELGMRYSDVREGLGPQTAPDQEIGSCDDPDFFRTVHFYPGLTVTENPDGTIWGIELSSMYAGEGDAALKGSVRPGTTLEEALAALGEPENASGIRDDCVLIYRQDGQDLYVFLDPGGSDTVMGVSMTLS